MADRETATGPIGLVQAFVNSVDLEDGPETLTTPGALGRIVAAAFAGMANEDWSRLKLCGSHTCRWAFFDRSRNHSSRWCTMAACGNRAKARRFRAQARKA